MTILDLVTIAFAAYCVLVITALIGAVLVTKEAVHWDSYAVLPLALLPYVALADLIVRAAS